MMVIEKDINNCIMIDKFTFYYLIIDYDEKEAYKKETNCIL